MQSPLPSVPAVASEPPSTPPERAGAAARWVRPAALGLVAVQVLVRWWLVAGRDYFSDDFRLLHLADASSLLSPSYLFQDYDGQFVPGPLLLAGLVERVGPLEWWSAALMVVLFQLLASLALLRVLRVLVGDRPLLLVPLAFGLFTPLTLGSVTWWAASLNSLPLQIGMALFLADAVLLARSGSRRYAVRGTVVFAVTLLFYVKTILVPWIGFAVVAVVLLRAGERSPVDAAWRRGRELWAGSLAVTAVWAAVHVIRDRPPLETGSVGNAVETIESGLRVLATAVLGGPPDWGFVPGSPPEAALPAWATVTGGLLLLAGAAWTCVRRRGAVAVWALVVAEVVIGLVVAAIGRGGLGLGHLLPLSGRYYAVEAVLLPVAGALLATIPLRRSGRMTWLADWLPRSGRGVVGTAGAATGAFVVAALLSTVHHAGAWQQDRSGAYLDTARGSLAEAGSTPMLDQQLPEDVLWSLFYPANQLSTALSPLEDRPPVEDWTPELRVLDDAGRLRPADVTSAGSVLVGPVPGCGWSIAPGDGTAVGLDASIMAWEWTARLDYVAGRDGTIVVGMAGEAPVRAPVRAGEHSVYLRLVGGGPTLQVTAETTGLRLCVRGGSVGDVVVR